MKRTIRLLIVAGLLAWPVAAGAGAVEDFGDVVGVCKIEDSSACGKAVWSFVDITGDDRLTPAELSRFLGVASEWTVADQIGLREAVGKLGFGGAAVDENMGRAGAVAMAFLSGPFTARLVLDNYDYDGGGASEVVIISGEIVNRSGDTRAAPDAIAQALDGNSRGLKTWRLAPQRGELGPNESTAFIGRLDDAPAAAVNWSVVLAGSE